MTRFLQSGRETGRGQRRLGFRAVRSPWPQGFPPVFVHSGWDESAERRLLDHPHYWPAKKARRAEAACATRRFRRSFAEAAVSGKKPR